MVNSRDDFSAKVKRAVAARAGWLCSLRGCGKHTTGPSEEGDDEVAITGEAAHICAASPGPGARRYDVSMTPGERSGINNAIWLCSDHAKLIDRDEARFTAEQLRAMKREHEAERARAQRTGSGAEFINADVRKDEDVRDLVDKTVARFGRLDVAVNNAGTEGQVGPITDQTAESYAATFDTNVLGVILSMKHEVRAMQGQGSGAIINISSTYGHEGAAGASVYVGSKHAVEGVTKSVALEVAKSGIRVNAVAPGPTDTGMLTRFTGTPENKAALVTTVPLGRLGLSEELANAIVFVASDEASFITGQVINVDGGKSH
jgi:NAD(P)-dependent dehydrogenase (short-subunit alcohol dehydrogenase family)